MKEAATAVIEFNRDLLGIAPRQLAPLEQDEFQHLMKCFREELNEFTEAHEVEDVVGCTDGIIDLMYFALGGLHKMGLNADQIGACFAAVHNYNMQKKRGQLAHRAVGDVPDAVKPTGVEAPEVEIARILRLTD